MIREEIAAKSKIYPLISKVAHIRSNNGMGVWDLTLIAFLSYERSFSSGLFIISGFYGAGVTYPQGLKDLPLVDDVCNHAGVFHGACDSVSAVLLNVYGHRPGCKNFQSGYA